MLGKNMIMDICKPCFCPSTTVYQ